MKYYKLSFDDMYSDYFHFTKRKNLESIEKTGLLPQKGNHAKYIEKTEKVFFVEGLDNLLILFDSWINVYKKVPILPDSKVTYGFLSKMIRSKYFPGFFVDLYFFLVKNCRINKEYAYKIFDSLLDESVLLQLKLEENIDFCFSDIDEIKVSGYRRRHLVELGYSEKYSDMDSNKMDRWNLHTLSNHGVDPSKMALCTINNSMSMRDILDYVLENTKLDLQDMCPNLYDYLYSRKGS